MSARGLTTDAIPYKSLMLDVEFDFIAHQLVIRTSEGRGTVNRPLTGAICRGVLCGVHGRLKSLGIEVSILRSPWKCPEPNPFPRRLSACQLRSRIRQSLLASAAPCACRIQPIRDFLHRQGEPVHFFWGSFDLAVTRFSGRPAPPRRWRGPHHARGLFSRSNQRRLLAGEHATRAGQKS